MSDCFTPRRPDMLVKACTKGANKRYHVVGTAWVNPDNSVSIQLRPGVTLSWNDGLTLVAFPVDDKNQHETET